MALNILEKGFTIPKTTSGFKSKKISYLQAEKMGRQLSAWQLARSSSSVAR